METLVSDEDLSGLRGALEERREAWMRFDLHTWFNVSVEWCRVERRLSDLRSQMQSEGHHELFIHQTQESFIQDSTVTIRNHATVVRSTHFGSHHDDAPSLLAKILCESIVGPHATIEDPKDGVTHLLQLAVRSELHKSILVAFNGEAAGFVLELMTRRNADGTHQGPLSAIWREHRSTMLRLLLRLAKRSETIPSALFLTGIVCTQRDSPIATGGNADIFSADFLGLSVVLKRLRVFQVVREGRENVKKFCREALLWSQLSHPFVQVFLGVDKDTFEGHYCMVTPWMEHGNINQCMNDWTTSGRSIPYDRWLLELGMGIEYLHQENVIHGDIRGNNILIDNDLHIRITDFGLSTYALSNTTSTGVVGGSTRWMAPELLNPNILDLPSFRSDVYAFGITCIEIYTRQQPFPELTNVAQVIQHVLKGERPTRPRGEAGRAMSFTLWVVIDSCWVPNPTDRPHISSVVASIRSLVGVPAIGIASTFEELGCDPESSLPGNPACRSYMPYVPIGVVILVYLGLALYTVIDGEPFDKIMLFFPLFMSFFIQVAYARTISGWIRRVTHWEVDERAFKDYCKHSILAGFSFMFLLLPVMVFTSR